MYFKLLVYMHILIFNRFLIPFGFVDFTNWLQKSTITIMLLTKLIVNLFILVATVTSNDTVAHNTGLLEILVVDNKFVDSKGYRFMIQGISYQRMREEDDNFLEGFGYKDPLANPETCLRDLKYLEDLNVNTVRVYQIDTSKNHDVCMNAFAAKGIYVLCDLAEPLVSINRNEPFWSIDVFDRYKEVVDSMHKYPNVLGFIAGNEVTNTVSNVDASPFVKASIRDTKRYLKAMNYRKIPVGYTGNDDARIRKNIADYFACGDEDSTADFLGINMYEWCGYSSYSTSGYRDRTLEFSEYPKPIFFSEFGCNTMNPRPFTEVEALFGLTMSKVWSGGIAYEYFQHDNNYGVVQENKNGTITPLDDFDTLSLRYATTNLKKQKVKESQTESVKTKCEKSEHWSASEKLPATPDRGKCECLQSTLSCIMSPYQKTNEMALLNEVCSKINCSEIQADGIEGEYGFFSDCSINQKVSYALDRFYKSNGMQETSCDFGGRAILVTNNSKMDLQGITLKDGRTCQEALPNQWLDPKSDHKHDTATGHSSFPYNENRNSTRPMKSGSIRVTPSVLAILSGISVFYVS